MIVVDVGCRPQGPEHSTDKLIERFGPLVYYGFDPDPGQRDEIQIKTDRPSVLVFKHAAAWTYDGIVEYAATGITGSVANAMMEARPVLVPCFDFSRWLRVLPDTRIVVKMDCEGAEYPLIQALIGHGLDARIELLLVEWHHEYETLHPGTLSWNDLEDRMRCEVEHWQ